MGVKALPHAGSIGWVRLGSAFRTAIACTIIGCTAVYGPPPVRHQIQYPSVAYITAILIVSDATLGSTLRGFWQALCATLLVAPSSVLCLWVVGPSRFSETGAALAVALSAFLVAVPECLPLLAKRIAFVQLVMIYVCAVVRGHGAGPVTLPVHIAACTALGASASVLALILPYPRLAVTEVKKHLKLYTENASERTSLYMKAFLSENETTADDLVSQAKPIAESGSQIVNHINLIQEGVKWERIHDFKRCVMNMGDRLDEIETPIKGMKMALAAIPSFPLEIINEQLRTVLQAAHVQQAMKLHYAKCFVPLADNLIIPETKDQLFDKSLNALTRVYPTRKNLPALFFLSCFDLLVNSSNMNPKPTRRPPHEPQTQTCKQRLVFALKCSISLGFSVLFGIIFDKENGYWSALTIAISFVEGPLPVFTVSNARVQGTAFGTVYAVLGSCLLKKVTELRFIILLPWIVFTSLLHHSRMFGESGGIAAVTGALLILGRKELAIARLTEVFIGLFFFVALELILQPVRTPTQVKRQLSRCLGTVDECFHQLATLKENGAPDFPTLKENIKKLKSDISKMRRLTQHAKSEPSLWFLRFRGSCYDNVQERLLKIADVMQVMIYDMEFMASNGSWSELQEHIHGDLVTFKENTSPWLLRLQKLSLVKSVKQETEGFVDLELGNRPLSTEATTKILDASLQHLWEVLDKTEEDEECKGKAIVHLNSLEFGIGSLLGETMQVEKCIKEMIRLENPSRRIDFNQLYYKIETSDEQGPRSILKICRDYLI